MPQAPKVPQVPMVLLVEARWDSSECYPIAGKKPPFLPPSPPALALVSSTDAV